MTNKIIVIKYFLFRVKPIWLILFCVFFLLVIEVSISFLFFLFKIPHESNHPLNLPNTYFEMILYFISRFIKACFIGPLIETLIFQYLIHYILCVKFKCNSILFIFLSALLFGLTHFFYLSTVILTFFICVFINFLYVNLIKGYQYRSSFIIIFLIHSIFNTCIFLNQILSISFKHSYLKVS